MQTLILKIRIIRLLIVATVLTGFVACTGKKLDPVAGNDHHYVVVLSMDGFRWDYPDRLDTPNLDYIARKGVRADYIKPAFPSKTFPNHYSMATGLYPANHGIVDNNFFCPELNLTFRIGDRQAVENAAFYGGEPIWVTAEKQGLKSASFFWVGSEAPVMGIQPTYWKRFDGSVPFINRIDTVIYWLELPSPKRPRLIMFYFQEPDSQGHDTGPESAEVDSVVMQLDLLVGELINRLKEIPHYDRVNLIVTSDHGMAEIRHERWIDIGRYTPRAWFTRTHGGNPVLHLWPLQGMMDSVYRILNGVENVRVWRRNAVPAEFNYTGNPRIGELIVMADHTWSVGWGSPLEPSVVEGAHGWDNSKPEMNAIFYAMGPAFRKGHAHPPIEVVDLYNLIAKILNLEPARNDGKVERISGMLQRKSR